MLFLNIIKKSFVVTLITLFIFFFSVAPVWAQGVNPFNFGGIVAFSYLCTCSLNWVVTIVGPKPAILSYYYTPQFANFQLPRMGVWTLGTYTPGAVCLDWYPGFPPFCAPSWMVPFGTILPLVGTSL